MEHLYFIFQNIWNRIGNLRRPSDSTRYRGGGVIWIFPLLITALFFISISHAEIKAKEEVSKDDAAKSQAQVTYGKLPLYFIQNDGQVDEKVKFYEKGSGHATFFTKEGVYISFVSGQTPPFSLPSPLMGEGQGGGDIANETNQSTDTSIPPFIKGRQGGITSELIKLTFLNANPNPEIIAVDQQEGKVNYFIGNDPRKWRTNIPTHQAVLYKEVYPGIDIKFYGNNRQLEYDIIVKPGADPSKVRLAYEGIEGLRVTENGDLEISLHSPSPSPTPIPAFSNGGISQRGLEGQGEGNKIIQKRPVIYQDIDGKRVEVEGRFKVLSGNVVTSKLLMTRRHTTKEQNIPPLQGEGKGGDGLSSGGTKEFAYTFELASYDKTHPLVIDPMLVYATYIGGGGDESSVDITVDTSGNAYVTGWTYSADFPDTLGAYDMTYHGNSDAFVVKLNASGSLLSYATYLGGSSSDIGQGIAVDTVGNVYVAGDTRSSDFPTTPGAYDTTINGVTDPNGPVDAFVVKLDASGSFLSYATYIGGSGYESGAEEIAVDAAGNVYVTGVTRSPDFPVTPGAYDTTINDSDSGDAYLAKLNTSGSFLSYATYLGGSNRDIGYGIAVDAAGNTYVTGETSSPDFPVSPGSYDTTFNGVYDAFVVKLNAAGSLLSYATYLGGSSDDLGTGIIVDNSGNAYLTGVTRSSDFPTTPGAYDTTFNGGNFDCFVVKLNAAGSLLFYATFIGGSNGEGGQITVDAAGNVYMGGGTSSSDFPVTPDAYDMTYNGNSDIFVAKLNPSGSLLSYATYIGGSDSDSGYGTAMDTAGNVYVTSNTGSPDFPATPGAYDTTYNGGRDVFVVKLNFPIELPRTGQTTCYDSAGAVITCAGTGQDGEILSGVPWPDPRFTVSTDGYCVTDNLTGLMWVRSPDGITRTWQQALDYANGLSLCGYDDWHLPNVNELESIVHAGQSNPAAWLNTQGFSNIQSNTYWSSTSYAFFTNSAWVVHMWYGGTYGYYKSGSYYVWPVRSGQSGVIQLPRTDQTTCYDSAGSVISCAGTGQDGDINAGISWPSPRFTVSTDGYCVTDNLTSLMWVRSPDGVVRTWQEALDYASGISLCGFTDWRLPNRKEFHNLIDFSRYSPSLQSGHPFLNVQSDLSLHYWSSTSMAGITDAAWVVSMWNGYMNGIYKSAGYYYVWPVRGGLVPPAEICDGIDNNGNGLIDEGVTNTYYQDTDGDTYGNVSVTTQACSQPSGYVSDSTDCDDGNASINPGAAEVCNLVDDNCDGNIDEGVQNIYYQDSDSDTYGNVLVTTQACTAPSGYVSNGADCNDGNPSINPGATEVCNSVDDNCNAQIDENVQNTYYRDSDNDTYGNASVTTQACTQPAGYVSNSTDCNDSNALIKPGATEVCNGVDDNCNAQIDEGVQNTYYQDADNDTYGNASVTTQACTQPAGYVSNSTDCNDGNASINPGATEVCNGLDDNCNGQTDEGVQNTYYRDADSDTYGNASITTQACIAPSGYVSNSSDCNDSNASIKPGATEVCNGVDDNCNAQIDEGVQNTYYRDADTDTYGNASVTTQACSAPSGYVTNSTDCNDSSASINPGAAEVCNGVDDNCNAQIDEGVQNTYYRDADNDTYGNASVTTQACTQPAGYVSNSTDCNDNNASIKPGATEVCNGVD